MLKGRFMDQELRVAQTGDEGKEAASLYSKVEGAFGNFRYWPAVFFAFPRRDAALFDVILFG